MTVRGVANLSDVVRGDGKEVHLVSQSLGSLDGGYVWVD